MIKPIKQPDDVTCGPTSLKIALKILGMNRPLNKLIRLCKTNSNGTSTNKMIQAILKLRLSALYVENSTLRHIRTALKTTRKIKRAILVSYLYDLDKDRIPNPESGHWAVVDTYQSNHDRIVLLDSASGKKKSYAWPEFRRRWVDYDLKRYRLNSKTPHFKYVRRWQPQGMLVISDQSKNLPHFATLKQKTFPSELN